MPPEEMKDVILSLCGENLNDPDWRIQGNRKDGFDVYHCHGAMTLELHTAHLEHALCYAKNVAGEHRQHMRLYFHIDLFDHQPNMIVDAVQPV